MDMTSADSKHSGDLGLAEFSGGVHLSYFQNSISIQPSLSVFLSNTASSFLLHVAHVVCLCANPKMFWIHAKFVVASVKNEFSFGNRTKSQNPNYSMRGFNRHPPTRRVNSAVAVVANRTVPLPARPSFFNFPPKSIREIWRKRLRETVSSFIVRTHCKLCLLCHAPGLGEGAGAFSVS